MIIELSQQTVDMVAKRVVDLLKETPSKEEYICTSEAAKILGISETWLRATKDKYPHKKRGDKQQGKLMFLKSALIK